MDDSARGMATQILRDMLNIGVRERGVGNLGEWNEFISYYWDDEFSERNGIESSAFWRSLCAIPDFYKDSVILPPLWRPMLIPTNFW